MKSEEWRQGEADANRRGGVRPPNKASHNHSLGRQTLPLQQKYKESLTNVGAIPLSRNNLFNDVIIQKGLNSHVQPLPVISLFLF